MSRHGAEARHRRPRPRESHFVGKTLADKWDPTAVLKDPGFAWDGSGYMSSRTQAIDETSMQPYANVLKILLEVAPTGFPAHKCLTECFEELDARHGVLACDARFVPRAASMATDNFRIMTKHIYNAALHGKVLEKGALQDLVKMIILPSVEDDGGGALASGPSFDAPSERAAAPSEGNAGPSEGTAADMSASAVKALFPDMGDSADDADAGGDAELEAQSDSDLELCGMTCNCQARRTARTVDLTGGEATPQIPSAQLGGQKRDTRSAQAALKGKGKGKDKDKVKGKGKSKSKSNSKSKGKGKGKHNGEGNAKTPTPTMKYTVRMRLQGKTRLTDAVAKGMEPAKKAKAPPKQKEVEIDGNEIILPATVIAREPKGTRRGEAYLLDGNKKYIMGLTSRRTDEYKDVVERAMEKINAATLKTKDELKKWFEDQIGFDTS